MPVQFVSLDDMGVLRRRKDGHKGLWYWNLLNSWDSHDVLCN